MVDTRSTKNVVEEGFPLLRDRLKPLLGSVDDFALASGAMNTGIPDADDLKAAKRVKERYIPDPGVTTLKEGAFGANMAVQTAKGKEARAKQAPQTNPDSAGVVFDTLDKVARPPEQISHMAGMKAPSTDNAP